MKQTPTNAQHVDFLFLKITFIYIARKFVDSSIPHRKLT